MSSKKISRSLVVSKALFKSQSAAIIRRLKIEVGSEMALFLTAPEQVGRPFVVTGYETVVSNDPMVFGGMTGVEVRFMVWDLETGDQRSDEMDTDNFLSADRLSEMSQVIISMTNHFDKHPEWGLTDITQRFDKLAFEIGTYRGDADAGYSHFYHIVFDVDSEFNYHIDQNSLGGFVMGLIRSLVMRRIKYVDLNYSVTKIVDESQSRLSLIASYQEHIKELEHQLESKE